MEKEVLIKTVLAAQSGDNDAMNTLFNESYNDCYYFALKTVKDDQLACDITQDSMIIILKTLKTLQEPAAYFGWMKKIVYNKCRDYCKKKTDVIVEEDEDGNTIFDTVAEDKSEFIPDEALNQSEFKKTILSMVDELSEEQRAAVLMYYFDEMSVSQIADIQGCSEGTVKSRLNYARKAIKESVNDYEKKHNIKLHAIPFFPMLRWVLGKGGQAGSQAGLSTMPISAAEAMAANVSAETGVSISVSAAATVAETAGTAAAVATTATKVGLLSKIVALPLAAKITAGVVAAAIIVSAVAVPLSLRKTPDTKPVSNGDGSEKQTSTPTDDSLTDEELFRKAWDIAYFKDFDGSPDIKEALEMILRDAPSHQGDDDECHYFYNYSDVEKLLKKRFSIDTSNLKSITCDRESIYYIEKSYYDASSDCFIREYEEFGASRFDAEEDPIEQKNTSVTKNADGTVTVIVAYYHTVSQLSDVRTIRMKVDGKEVTYLSKSSKMAEKQADAAPTTTSPTASTSGNTPTTSSVPQTTTPTEPVDPLKKKFEEFAYVLFSANITRSFYFDSTDSISAVEATGIICDYYDMDKYEGNEPETNCIQYTIPLADVNKMSTELFGRIYDFSLLQDQYGSCMRVNFDNSSQAIVCVQGGVGGFTSYYEVGEYTTSDNENYTIDINEYNYDDETEASTLADSHTLKVRNNGGKWMLVSYTE